MKRLSVLLLIVSAALLSCKKDKNDDLLSGTYKGTFRRVGPGLTGQISEVTITFEGNRFSGQSTVNTRPGICNGSFSQDGTKINFDNSCAWTADFDWTYILDGEYEISQAGDYIEISKSYNGTVFYQDLYKLAKE